MANTSSLDHGRLVRLIGVGRALVAQRDLEQLLEEVLEAAREITSARYAALGILDEGRSHLDRFITAGIDESARAVIGELPHGRGVLGELITHPMPLRLDDVNKHPHSYGFPPGHPEMRTFLGVPVTIRGEPWGNLYLTEKDDGPFTAADEEALIVLADWAAIAIDNARLYGRLEARRHQLERAVVRLEATTQVARAVGGETDLDRVLELIVKRGRALVGARSMLILLVDGRDFVVAASAGEIDTDAAGLRFPIEGSVSGTVLASGQPARFSEFPGRLALAGEPGATGRLPAEFGLTDPEVAMLAPLLFRDAQIGVISALDRDHDDDAGWTADDERLLVSFAASAATAVHTAQSVAADQLRRSIEAAEEERRRWARELHDETLQGLGALQILLAAAVEDAPASPLEQAVREAIGHIENEAYSLRSLIAELRPASLDDLGLAAAIETLAERLRTVEGLVIDTDLKIGSGPDRLPPDLENTIYRLVQESLTNAAKHARAERVEIAIHAAAESVDVRIRDNGTGFDPRAATAGFGLLGMRERVALTHGTLEIDSVPGTGTTITATFPRPVAPARLSSGG